VIIITVKMAHFCEVLHSFWKLYDKVVKFCYAFMYRNDSPLCYTYQTLKTRWKSTFNIKAFRLTIIWSRFANLQKGRKSTDGFFYFSDTVEISEVCFLLLQQTFLNRSFSTRNRGASSFSAWYSSSMCFKLWWILNTWLHNT